MEPDLCICLRGVPADISKTFELGEENFEGKEEKYCFYKNGQLLKLIELGWGSGEGGVNLLAELKPIFIIINHDFDLNEEYLLCMVKVK